MSMDALQDKYIQLKDEERNNGEKPRSRNKPSLAEEKEAKRISDAIDRQIHLERLAKEREKSAKLLLLGAAESGKTTVLKQIRIIHGGGLASQRNQYQRIVFLNTINAMKSLCAALNAHEIPLTIPDYREHVDFILGMANTTDPTFMNGQSITSLLAKRHSTDAPTASSLFQQAAPAIKALWGDAAIKGVFTRGLAKDIQDSAKYFLDSIDRLSEDDYEPTDTDILQARVKTIGITEHKFEIDSVVYRIYDVGGQRAQRKYWAPYFDDCNAIIFMAAISAFDQTLIEDPSVNRMVDAILLFETICNNALIRQTAMILFLNKIDVLKRKIEAGVLVKDYFKEYRNPNDFESITSFFQSLFFAQNKTPQKEIYVHLTHATDTKQMRVIVAAVNVIVQRMNLRNSGLL